MDTDSHTCWQNLDLREFAQITSERESPEQWWQDIVLSVCGERGALRCIEAIDALQEGAQEQEVGGRTVAAWVEVGKHYVDQCLLSLGAAAQYEEGAVLQVPRYCSIGVVPDLLQGHSDAKALHRLSTYAFASNDPLFWFDAALPLVRLAIAHKDAEILSTLHSICKERYSKAPWFSLVDSLCLRCEGGTRSQSAKVDPVDITPLPPEEGHRALAHLQSESREAAPSRVVSLAGLQAIVDPSHTRSVVVRLTWSTLDAFLRSGAIVIVHEERPIKAGFARLWDVDVEHSRVLADSMHVLGWECRSWEEQEAKMEHYGSCCFVLWPSEVPGEYSECHDENLATLGAVEEDQLDAQAGRARREELARLAVEACPDIPRAWQLHGIALLEQQKARELEEGTADGKVEKWYAQARTLFARAEWAHQIYAQALELWGQFEEAAIAWNDALHLDARDARNVLGIARTRAREGMNTAAQFAAREALALDPSDVDAWRLNGELALISGSEKIAELAGRIVLQVEPTDATSHRILADCAEKRGELSEALAHLDRASQKGGSASLARGSIVAARMGDSEGALQRASAALDREPEDFANHLRLSECFVRSGMWEDAIGVLEFALSRFGPHSPLVQAYIDRIGKLLPLPAVQEKVRVCIQNWSEYEQAIVDLSLCLANQGYLALAEECSDTALTANPESLNPQWKRVEMCMRNGKRKQASEILGPMLEKVTLPHAFAVWTELHGDTQTDEVWQVLAKADASHNPALVWGAAHYLATLRGEDETASGLQERMWGIGTQALGAGMHFLLHTHSHKLAKHLLPLLVQHPEAESDQESILQLQALCAFRFGQGSEGCAFLVERVEKNTDTIVSWEELKWALGAGCGESLQGLAKKALTRVVRESPESFGDGMVERSYVAAADALLDNFSGITQLLDEHPTNLFVLECAARAAHMRNNTLSERVKSVLEEIAPGLALTLEREWEKREDKAAE